MRIVGFNCVGLFFITFLNFCVPSISDISINTTENSKSNHHTHMHSKSDTSTSPKCQTDIDMAKELAPPISNLAGRLLAIFTQQQPHSNLVFSPVSTAMSLALLEQGAQKDTKTELLKLLSDETMDNSDIGQSYEALQQQLTVRNAKSEHLSMANGLFFRQAMKIRSKYAKKITTCFHAAIKHLPPEEDEAMKMINDWVSNHTNGDIPSLISPGMITQMTKAILVNAAHLKAAWEKPFHKIETLAFYAHGKDPQFVPFISNTEYYKYYVVGDYQMVDLPYLGNELTMVIAMKTQENESKIGKSAEDSLLFASRASFQREPEFLRLELKLPKFQVKSSMDLKEKLMQIGLVEMFTEKADFGGMSKEQIQVTDALHEAHIKVDENGTEASAATAVELGYKSRPTTPIPVIINRPFTFAIVHNPTGVTVFMGKVNHIL